MTNKSNAEVAAPNGSCNAHLEREVCERFGQSGHLELRRVSVTVDEKSVSLSGSVPTYYMKQMAQETARKVCPDRKVFNQLVVASAPA